ncbi:extensin-like domain-containing protein [Bosea sp. (in: a-proteobacteria)]|uniref:extensin-like domain-containing protein n=1 Tax=Bosea sp. (in: a-proteobacteria) TaxID=1871050 RepID=UPI002FCB5A8E
MALALAALTIWLLAAITVGIPAALAREAVSGRPVSTRLPPPRPPGLPATSPSPTPTPPAPQPPAAPASVSPPEKEEAAGTCLSALAGVAGNQVRAAPPSATLATEGCTVVEPVIVEAFAVRRPDGAGAIRLLPPPTVSCEMARALSVWFDTALVPLARGALAKELTALRVGGGHECRRRNGQSQTPMSEHATGRALDIFAFELGEERQGGEKQQGGLAVSVEKPDGLDQTRFLDAVRQSACGAFMTALGPGSDAAHANHLHVDIQQRRASSSRFCQ